MKLAVVQTNPIFGEKTANIAAAICLMKSVNADLYVLPELFASGYNFVDEYEVHELSEKFAEGETFYALHEFCRNNDCYVVYGFAENDNGELFNSSGLIGPSGAIGLYRKIHLYNREKLFFQPGNIPFSVFELPFGRIGMMVCFDWYFPESARTLALRGAQLIAHPSNLVGAHCPDSMPVRSRDNCVFTATADRVGIEDRGGYKFGFIGRSQIVTPNGSILQRAGDKEEQIIVSDIEFSDADNKRITEYNDLFDDLRPEYY
ncbi:MAG: nitrilase-related carbon-nitrogen hydrolase [Negativicutes bacterium]|jgi:predicted amidohydrolase